MPLSVAARALLDERRHLTRDEALAVADLPLDELPSLIALAHKVRLEWCGPEVELESLINAKSGACPEDCAFCSQSVRYSTGVDVYAFLDIDEIVEAAHATRAAGATQFCIVVALRELDPCEVPINLLDPRPGTPLEHSTTLSPREALQAIALYRLILPGAWLRLAGGRERVLGELQGMGLVAGANALIVGNYLTTIGRSPEEDHALLDALGMPVADGPGEGRFVVDATGAHARPARRSIPVEVE